MSSEATSSRRTLRGLAKRAALGLGLLFVWPSVLASRLEARLGRGEWLFQTFACLLSLVPGRPGCLLRNAYYWGTLQRYSPDVTIHFGSFFTHRGAEVGSFVSIGAYCVLGTVSLGDYAMVASRVSIPSGRQQHSRTEEGSFEGNISFERVSIGEHTWIGEGAIVLADVGSYCTVGAGSVVRRPVGDRLTVSGNPARVAAFAAPAQQGAGAPAAGLMVAK